MASVAATSKTGPGAIATDVAEGKCDGTDPARLARDVLRPAARGDVIPVAPIFPRLASEHIGSARPRDVARQLGVGNAALDQAAALGLLPAGARSWSAEAAAAAEYASAPQLHRPATRPPDGLCLSYCCRAALHLEAWLAAQRDPIGFCVNRLDDEAWKKQAVAFRARVIGSLRRDGVDDAADELERGRFARG